MTKKIKVILFDLGNVLIDWDPRLLLDELFNSNPSRDLSRAKSFMANWNNEYDLGRLDASAARRIADFPEYTDIICGYRDRWIETLGWPIEGTVEILKELKKSGYSLYAASNWAADTFELAQPRMPFLNEFDGIQISGLVGIVKPDKQFFEKMMDTFRFAPSEAIFIDDKEANVSSAAQLGITAIHFQNPKQLKQNLISLGIF